MFQSQPNSPLFRRIFSLLSAACLLSVLLVSVAQAGQWVAMDSTTDTRFRRIFGFAGDDLYAVGYGIGDGRIYHYDGQQWGIMAEPGGYAFYDVWGASPDDIWVVGGFGTILHYNGFVWSQQSLPTASNFIGIHGTASDDIMAVASDGSIMHYDGESWLEMETSSPLQLFSVWGRAADDYWAVGDTWTIHHYDGQSWSCVLEQGDLIWGIWAAAADDVWAAGFQGRTFHFDGTDWTEQASATSYTVYGLWGAAADDIYSVGTQGRIQHFDGQDWTIMDSPTDENLLGVWGLSAEEIFIVGENGTILRYDAASPATQDLQRATPRLNAWPNPFNPGTVLRLSLPAAETVCLTLHDFQGHRVCRLYQGELTAGSHQFRWNGCDDQGRPVATGVYFARLSGPSIHQVVKLTLLK
jgi:hypothetical protein